MDHYELKEQWRKRLKMSKSEATIRNYMRALRKFEAFLRNHDNNNLDPRRWDDQTMVDFDAYLRDEKELAAGTRHLNESALRQFGKFLVIRQVWDSNHFARVELPSQPPSKPDVAPKETILKRLNKPAKTPLDKRDKAMTYLMYAGALRRMEVRILKDEDLHLDDEYIEVLGKGDKRRTVPLTDRVGKQAIKHLREYLEVRHKFKHPSEYVFWTMRGSPDEPVSIHTTWRACRNWVDMSCHKLRRSRLTHLAEAGVPSTHLRDFAGHSSMETTMKYYVNISEAATANAIRNADA